MVGKCNGLDKALDTICVERALARKQQDAPAFSGLDERAARLAELKKQIRDGIYKPDIKDIARMLTGALTR